MAKATKLSFAHRIDGATDFEDIKRRLTSAFVQIEKLFEAQTRIFYVDANTSNDPSLYKQGDIIVDSSIIPGAITIYAYDANLTKITQTLQTITGTLPLSFNELFLGDGATTIFNSAVQYVARTTQVYKAGLRQTYATDYTEASNRKQIVFTVAPATGAKIVLDYHADTTL